MEEFMIASVNKKEIRQSIGLEPQVIRYTPALAESQEELIKQFEKAEPEQMVIIVMPVDILKSNMEILTSMKKQREFQN